MDNTQASAYEDALIGLRKRWAKLQNKETNYTFDVPDVTLKECFNYWAEKNADKPYVYDRDGQVYYYRECNERAKRIANGLAALGCKKGDRVALFLSNGIDYILAAQACFKIGAIILNGNPFESSREIAYKLNDSTAKIVLLDECSVSDVLTAIDFLDFSLEHVVYCGELDAPSKNKSDYQVTTLKKIIEENEDAEPEVNLHPDEIQVLQYTGGTTGLTKGCCITHRSYINEALASVEFLKGTLDREERFVVLGLPLSHSYGFTQVITDNLVCGGNMVLLSAKPSLEEMLEAIAKYKATIWPVVPFILNSLADQIELFEKYDVSSLRAIFCGAAPLPVSTIEAIEEVSNAQITEGYGMTEVVGTATGMPFGIRRAGMSGIPYPNVEVLIVDIETGTSPVKIGEHGEVIIKSGKVNGYWENPEETAKTIRDGWIHSGDIGYFAEDGMLGIVGRLKEMILVSGFNVYPREIDEVLQTHPDIIEACTIGVPDKKRGEVPKSYIKKKETSSLSVENIHEFLLDRLARYKVSREIEFVDEIPKTKTGKPDYNELRKHHQSSSEKNDC